MTTNEKLKEFEKKLQGRYRHFRIDEKNGTTFLSSAVITSVDTDFQQLFSYELKGGYHGKDKNPSND